ncbi:MAG: hypothetical protein U9N10_06485 [Bacillota bacterium]|nr:hypothetical protein [Bacillota bacterium]
MRKTIILLISLFCANYINAQNFIFSTKAGLAYPSSLECETGIIFTGSFENRFNKYFSLGINGKAGGVNYNQEKSILDNEIITEEIELDISNSIYAINIYPKISFFNSTELTLSIIPELGFYWVRSTPVIYFKDKINFDVSHKNYNTEWSNKNFGLGLHLEGQYYLSDKTNISASIGWSNYDIGLSLNDINLEGDFNYEFNENTNFLYCEVGISFLLFGKNTWD